MNLCGDKNSGIDSIRATLLTAMNLQGDYGSLPHKSGWLDSDEK
jgi:hypothetical protein